MNIIESPFPPTSPRNLTITERVFDEIDPNQVVMIDGPTGRSLTGEQFIQQTKSIAGGLTERGWGVGKVVALMAPNIPEYAVIFHASAWAGATITTVNPTYTAHEVNHQLTDSGADVLITVSMFAETAKQAIEGTGVSDIVVIDEAPAGTIALSELAAKPLEHQVPVDLDDHVVALPFSSGTTGLPKGVMLTNRNLVINVDQLLVSANIGRGEKSVVFLPFFHIYGLQVLMNSYLAAGGTLITMPRFDLEQYLDLVTEHQSPKLWIVPPVASALSMHPLVENYDLGFVHQINSAAAPLSAELALKVEQKLGICPTQGYGMTELSPVSHISVPEAGKPGASGQTASSTQSRIVDPETLIDVEPGQDGELWVKGPQTMKGYLNNPEATKEVITADGWLRTGDVAHFDDDGYLFVTDRLKELIKFKGFQVAPAELEAELICHPKIADAAVVGLPDEEAGEIPAAFIVAAPGEAAPSFEDVKEFLSTRLAHYKQVRSMTVLESIPKSASGKILRRVLRDGLIVSEAAN